MFCGSCGAKNPDDAKFCSSCGKPLIPPGEAVTPPAPKPPVDNTQLYRDAARDFAAQKESDAVRDVRAHVRMVLDIRGQTAEQAKQELISKGFEPSQADLLVAQERAKLAASNLAIKKSRRREQGGWNVIGGIVAMFLAYRIVAGLNEKGFQWDFQDWSQWLPALIFLGGLIAIVRGIYLLALST